MESFEPELFTDEDPPTLRDLTEEKKGGNHGGKKNFHQDMEENEDDPEWMNDEIDIDEIFEFNQM
jgi:hypothetical protein